MVCGVRGGRVTMFNAIGRLCSFTSRGFIKFQSFFFYCGSFVFGRPSILNQVWAFVFVYYFLSAGSWRPLDGTYTTGSSLSILMISGPFSLVFFWLLRRFQPLLLCLIKAAFTWFGRFGHHIRHFSFQIMRTENTNENERLVVVRRSLDKHFSSFAKILGWRTGTRPKFLQLTILKWKCSKCITLNARCITKQDTNWLVGRSRLIVGWRWKIHSTTAGHSQVTKCRVHFDLHSFL